MTTSKSSRPDRPAGQSGRHERPEPRPGQITALQPQARDPDRVNVYIDGEFAIGLHQDVVLQAGLAVGEEVDTAALAEIVAAEERQAATAAALNFLAYRPRSEGEVRSRLRRGGYPDDVVEHVLDQVRAWRYVDDEDFARRWVENRGTHRPRGARLLVQELRTKGVDPTVASEAIAGAELDEAADALELARQRSSRLTGLDPAVRDRRLGAFLARRGYGFDIIRTTLATLREEIGDDSERGDMRGSSDA